jgi:hypothetical protein
VGRHGAAPTAGRTAAEREGSLSSLDRRRATSPVAPCSGQPFRGPRGVRAG